MPPHGGRQRSLPSAPQKPRRRRQGGACTGTRASPSWAPGRCPQGARTRTGAGGRLAAESRWR
eukprot:scaffold59840_cov27-Phaeocystis_antarctica.AAC.1